MALKDHLQENMTSTSQREIITALGVTNSYSHPIQSLIRDVDGQRSAMKQRMRISLNWKTQVME